METQPDSEEESGWILRRQLGKEYLIPNRLEVPHHSWVHPKGTLYALGKYELHDLSFVNAVYEISVLIHFFLFLIS